MWRWWRRRQERRQQALRERWHAEQDQAYREAVQRILHDSDASAVVDSRPGWNAPTVGHTEPRMTLGELWRGNGGRWPR